MIYYSPVKALGVVEYGDQVRSLVSIYTEEYAGKEIEGVNTLD